MVQFHSGKTSLPRDSLSHCMTSLILASLTFPHWRSLCLLLRTFERSICGKAAHDQTKQTLTLPKLPFPSTLIKLKSDNPNFFCRRLIPGDVSRSLGVIGSGSRWFSFLLSCFMFVPLYSIEGCKINKENHDQLKGTLMTPNIGCTIQWWSQQERIEKLVLSPQVFHYKALQVWLDHLTLKSKKHLISPANIVNKGNYHGHPYKTGVPSTLLGTPGTMASFLCLKYEEKRLADYESCCLRKPD